MKQVLWMFLIRPTPRITRHRASKTYLNYKCLRWRMTFEK
jgi:hypothetical protein